MRDKYDYMQQFNTNSKEDIAKTLAIFGAFTEGLQLFATFAILLNFPRFNKMKGMGQIVTWSARDESLHTESIIKLYNTFVSENPEINKEENMDRIKKNIIEPIIHNTVYQLYPYILIFIIIMIALVLMVVSILCLNIRYHTQQLS